VPPRPRPRPPLPPPPTLSTPAITLAPCARAVDCKDRNQLFEKIKKGALEFPPYLSGDARALLTALLERDPSRRLGCGVGDAADIKAHPFFRTVNWEALRAGRLPSPFVPPVLGSCDTSQFDTEFTSMPIVSPSSLKDGPAGASAAGKPNFEGFTFVAPHAVGPGAVGGAAAAAAAAAGGGGGGGGGGDAGGAYGGGSAAAAFFAQQQQQQLLQQQQQQQQQQLLLLQQQLAFAQQQAQQQLPSAGGGGRDADMS
jgi:hypothetical protein